MSSHRVVVDGSNIATEGRSLPSLVQLDEAVRAYREEHPDAEIIVVVDATFAHRIDDSERGMFEEAAAHNELVYPPAGAIGRGDAFLLRIADKTDAVVLSNDSFQEFHGEFEWLFEKGRLIGGTPVPGVGWIFVPRTPVRGPKSREAVKEAKRGRARIGSKDASQPMPVPKAPPPRRSPRNKDAKGGDTVKPPKQGALKAAIDEATEEAVEAELVTDAGDAEGAGGGGRKRRRKRKSGGTAALPTVNEPLTFIQFIAEHQPGATVEGEIESFASHGAFVLVGDARCYIPLSAMGEPPPRAAREVLNRGETRSFVVQALDAPRRGIELALPGFARVAGRPTDETVEAEIEEAPPPGTARRSRGGRKSTAAPRGRRAAASDGSAPAATPAADAVPIVPEAPVIPPLPAPKKTARRKAAAAVEPEVAKDTKPAARKAAAKAAMAKKAAKKAAPEKATPEKAAAKVKKAAVKVAAVKKAPPADKPADKPTPKKAPPKKAPAKTAVPRKATVDKAAPKKAAPAKKAAVRTAAPAKNTAAKKAVPAKKAAVKQAPAKKAVPAKKAAKKTAT